jgi:hypothetical protein
VIASGAVMIPPGGSLIGLIKDRQWCRHRLHRADRVGQILTEKDALVQVRHGRPLFLLATPSRLAVSGTEVEGRWLMSRYNKHFGHLHVLKDVSLDVARGDVVILGLSGSSRHLPVA